jgi:hypothetical protein
VNPAGKPGLNVRERDFEKFNNEPEPGSGGTNVFELLWVVLGKIRFSGPCENSN